MRLRECGVSCKTTMAQVFDRETVYLRAGQRENATLFGGGMITFHIIVKNIPPEVYIFRVICRQLVMHPSNWIYDLHLIDTRPSRCAHIAGTVRAPSIALR